MYKNIGHWARWSVAVELNQQSSDILLGSGRSSTSGGAGSSCSPGRIGAIPACGPAGPSPDPDALLEALLGSDAELWRGLPRRNERWRAAVRARRRMQQRQDGEGELEEEVEEVGYFVDEAQAAVAEAWVARHQLQAVCGQRGAVALLAVEGSSSSSGEEDGGDSEEGSDMGL